ncbi:MAG TPA: phospholipase D-like domain-containing protein [Candidatus Bathyarchaeia archaeon]|nr:phospholipase D-like domain-containing protein [Candidatus Bathyarchaeia archaeon]
MLSIPQQSLLLASPFVTRPVTDWISENLSKNPAIQTLQIVCLTNIRITSVLAGFLDLEALAELARTFNHVAVVHIPSLHAKVYAADETYAIITSGNLTPGGIKGNCEYGVAIQIPEQVREIRRDFEAYGRLGAPIAVDEISTLALELAALTNQYRAKERQVIRTAGAAFRSRLHAAQEKVLRFRARGKSNQAIFCDTIKYLLSKGPLRTIELHPLVQQIHPDICDDNVDRVIDGVNFGKKWKHHVRTAQQALKREGQISFDGERWHLTT